MLNTTSSAKIAVNLEVQSHLLSIISGSQFFTTVVLRVDEKKVFISRYTAFEIFIQFDQEQLLCYPLTLKSL